MGRGRKILRRTFLYGSVAVVGGVAFGAYYVRAPYDNPLAVDLPDGAATFNPFVMITADAITVIAPHADLGQGVASLQTALIAEELDADLDQITTCFGSPDPAYYNTAIADESVPFQSFNTSTLADGARSVAGAAVKVLGLMITGGSTSASDQYEKLRHAGAVARETLKLAASHMTDTPVEDLRTQAGAVILPDGRTLPYTALAITAAGITPVTDVTLREPSTWRLLGQDMQRVDMLAKSTGTLDYSIDQQVDGMVHATVRTNPRQGGALLGYDDQTARQMRGVLAIVPVTGGIAVIADNTWRAMQAAQAVVCNWGPAPYPAEMADHWQAVSDSFTEDRLDKVWRDDGDVANTLQSGNVINAEYRAPYVAHQPLEPLSAIVRIDIAKAEVWAAHQVPRFVQSKVAAIAGCDPAHVVFHQQYAGGSFGHRLEFENITLAAEIAAQLPGTPVKLTYSREEDFAHDFPRQIGMARASGKSVDGLITCYDLRIATPSASASQAGRLGVPLPGPDMQIVAGAWNMPYAIPNLRVSGYRVPELAPVSSWRSVGASTAGFFAEGFMDELIAVAGADPLEERLRLVNNDVHRKVLEAVGDMSSWGAVLGPNRGRGLAMVESFGVAVAMVVDVTLTDHGIKIDDVFVAADVGRVLDPVNFDNIVKGGVIWGLGHAINAEITYADGMAQQNNFHVHAGMRMFQTPKITVRGLENADKVRGIGEPPVPPAAPALANAIFAATGTRLREMPFQTFIDFV